MGETVTSALNIGKRVHMRRNFSSLLNSISSTSESVFLIPDHDVQQCKGVHGAFEQPEVHVQVISQVLSDSSPPQGSGGVERSSTSGGGNVEDSSGSHIFVPS